MQFYRNTFLLCYKIHVDLYKKYFFMNTGVLIYLFISERMILFSQSLPSLSISLFLSLSLSLSLWKKDIPDALTYVLFGHS